MANADCIIIQGSNMAECHPVGYQWVAEAKARGAAVIHVDPRFTRTSAVCDKHIAIRAGSDVALLGALINYVLDNDLWFREYVVAYTNAATIINADFRDTEDLGGLFSGFDPADFDYLARAVTANSGRERTTRFAYAVGWTQHTLGARGLTEARRLAVLGVIGDLIATRPPASDPVSR